jgi:hypothetical protein
MSITAAAVRLSNNPAPLDQRLAAAEAQINRAADQGAQLIVLPEVFNTGYTYSPDNYSLAEPIDGPTVTWMKRLTAEGGIHLAGSLLLLGPEHITNSLLLVAPDGRIWRYDKNFPWTWERLYFREGTDITIAQTDIGTFGLMICIDVAPTHLFERYAGHVQALIISASPPRAHELMLSFPDGGRVTLGSLVRLSHEGREQASQTFNEHVRNLTRWMGVPAVQAIPYGEFSSSIPIPWLSLGLLMAPKQSLWRYIPQGKKATITGCYFNDNQITDAEGNILSRYEENADGFALATLELPAIPPPAPTSEPPASPLIPPPDLFYELLIPFYRRGVRKAWGSRMAPVDRHTKMWLRWVMAAGIGGFVLAKLTKLVEGD